MQIISGTTQFQIPEETAAAIGKFDGVHLGHQKILEMIFRQRKRGRRTAVFTFDPSPAVFFSSRGEEVRELSTREEKRRLFAGMGVDYLIEFPF